MANLSEITSGDMEIRAWLSTPQLLPRRWWGTGRASRRHPWWWRTGWPPAGCWWCHSRRGRRRWSPRTCGRMSELWRRAVKILCSVCNNLTIEFKIKRYLCRISSREGQVNSPDPNCVHCLWNKHLFIIDKIGQCDIALLTLVVIEVGISAHIADVVVVASVVVRFVALVVISSSQTGSVTPIMEVR